jgi:hypothetical protein
MGPVVDHHKCARCGRDFTALRWTEPTPTHCKGCAAEARAAAAIRDFCRPVLCIRVASPHAVFTASDFTTEPEI